MPERTGIPVSIRNVAEFVGVTAGGGAGFAALSFGIGYLATKHHDAMLGVPTTTTDQTTYVRTGALFFSQTLHDIVAFIASMSLDAVRWALLAILIGLILRGMVSAVWRNVHKRVRGEMLTVVLSSAVLASCLVTLPYHLAALDPGNKNLLFEQRSMVGTAAEINAALRKPDGEDDLHRLYGWQSTRLLLLALGLFLARRVAVRTEEVPPPEGNDAPRMTVKASRRVLQPVALGAIAAMIATTPANYGVLAMSTSLPCVQLYRTEEKELGLQGFLFSDLSSEEARIAILRWDAEAKTYFVDFHPRDSLGLLEVKNCGVRHPIQRIIKGRS